MTDFLYYRKIAPEALFAAQVAADKLLNIQGAETIESLYEEIYGYLHFQQSCFLCGDFLFQS